MKKAFPYLIGGVVLVLLVVLMMSSAGKPQRKFDERVTLRRGDKIPYGTRVAWELLPTMFTDARFIYDRKSSMDWDSLDYYGTKQAVVIVADYFDADKSELDELASFVKNGNYVFIIGRAASDEVTSYFNVTFNADYYPGYKVEEDDSLQVKLEPVIFPATGVYSYPGKKYDGSFYKLDTLHTTVLGRDEKGHPDFVQLDHGKGSFFLHTAPLAFSNYFLLHKNNVAYFEQAFSVLPKNLEAILWNEYFLERPRRADENKDPNWLGALFSNPAFKWGLLTGAFTLALFVLLGMRRRQRMIPVYQRPKNDSLDFVKTLGRLYYDRKDHHNLAGKMAAYFLEHVRSKYKLPTHTLDNVFIEALHFKSGYPEPETRRIIETIHHIHTTNNVSETGLADFYKQLELFYQNT